VRTRIGVCVRVSVCVCFVDASLTVAVQIKVRTCVLVYEYLYVSVSWLPGICMRVRDRGCVCGGGVYGRRSDALHMNMWVRRVKTSASVSESLCARERGREKKREEK